MNSFCGRLAAGSWVLLMAISAVSASASENVWLQQELPPAVRAAALVAELTQEEKLQLVYGHMPMLMRKRPDDAVMAAGYVTGVPRLGIPPLRETDASLGVANLLNMRRDDVATALPSALSLASSWDPELAYATGAMIGSEARAKRFNVMLAGGVNLAREPRNGRNFEYLGEDPLLAGILAGESIRGVQSNGIVSTVKHFAFNNQEIGRSVLSARIGEAPARESELLAFQLAIERGRPGSVMAAYNRVNGQYSSENDWLLNKVLKGDWAYPGWVMSDWGGVHSTVAAALGGLDQQSGAELDKQPFFGAPLKLAIEQGAVPQARLDDMVRRILHGLIASGAFDRPADTAEPIDYAANAAVAERAAEQGTVLLKNDGGLLPLSAKLKSIAVIGGHADVGVLSGGGSTQVRPVGGPALEIRLKSGPAAMFARRTYYPSSPLKAIQARFPQAQVGYADGSDLAAAEALARKVDVVLVFGEEWRTEAQDNLGLGLDGEQDALVAAMARANPRTVVILQTGGAVLMPWLSRVPAVLQAWYPGQRGGEAIASVLSGAVNPSGRLPLSFPASLDQLPRPQLDGSDDDQLNANATYAVVQNAKPFEVDYDIDGANLGYRWYALKGHRPLFPFGHGLSYTRFDYSKLRVTGGETIRARLTVRNRGKRAGIATPQVYAMVAVRGGPPVPRLIGWQRVGLKPGERREVEIVADPRLLAEYDTELPGWRIRGGEVRVSVGDNAGDIRLETSARLEAAVLKP